MNTASSLDEISEREVKKVPALRGKTVVNLFHEPSTRTRISFELAAKRLSADVINISASASATSKGESLIDTAETLEAMGADIVILRHRMSGTPHLLSRAIKGSVINAGDGKHEHPTQALLDLFAIKKHLSDVRGKRVLIVGDISHSRVARSVIKLFYMVGMKVTVVAPPTLIPWGIESLGCESCYEFDAVLPEADVVYMLRMQKERQAQHLYPSVQEYSLLYGLNSEKLASCKKDALILHPGPVNRGVEITGSVMEDPRCILLDQVAGGITVRMAVMLWILQEERSQ